MCVRAITAGDYALLVTWYPTRFGLSDVNGSTQAFANAFFVNALAGLNMRFIPATTGTSAVQPLRQERCSS
jgi:hypothetical protein